jgi:small subunit ribosomal protein S2
MLDLKEFLKAGVHFGHRSSRWSPKMRPFIWGSKNRVHLIDVAKTAFLLERAGKYLKDLVSQGKSVLWIGTKKPAQATIKKIATSLKMPFVINRWIGGTLTNFNQVKKAITRFLYLQDIIKKPSIHYKKKEISMIQKEIARLEKNIGGILDLEYPPGAIVLIDAKKEHSAIKEAMHAGIPIVAMVDTNTDPTGVNLIIPANDDSPRSITFIMQYLGSCVEEGKKIYQETKKEEIREKEEAKKEAARKIKKDVEKKAVAPKAQPVKVATPKAPAKEAKKEEPVIKEKKETEKKSVTTKSTSTKSAKTTKSSTKK